ncbi:hypothetical protein B7463_g6971, partial [Scytalidium lignicola]
METAAQSRDKVICPEMAALTQKDTTRMLINTPWTALLLKYDQKDIHIETLDTLGLLQHLNKSLQQRIFRHNYKPDGIVIAFQWPEGSVVHGTLFFVSAPQGVVDDVASDIILSQRAAEKAHPYQLRKQIFTLDLFKSGQRGELFADWCPCSLGLETAHLPELSKNHSRKMVDRATVANVAFDARLFSRACRLLPEDGPMICRYKLHGPSKLCERFVQSDWEIEHTAFLQIKEIILPRLQESPVAADFQRIATAFFNGETIYYTEDDSLVNRETSSTADHIPNHIITYENESLKALQDAFYDPLFIKFVTDTARANKLEECIKKREKYHGLTVSRGREYLTSTKILDIAEREQKRAIIQGNAARLSEFRQIDTIIDMLRCLPEGEILEFDIEISSDSEDVGKNNGSAGSQQVTRTPISAKEQDADKMGKSSTKRKNKERSSGMDTTQLQSQKASTARYEIGKNNNTKQEQPNSLEQVQVNLIQPDAIATVPSDYHTGTTRATLENIVTEDTRHQYSQTTLSTNQISSDSTNLYEMAKAKGHHRVNEDGSSSKSTQHKKKDQLKVANKFTSGNNQKKEESEDGSQIKVDHSSDDKIKEINQSGTNASINLNTAETHGDVEMENNREKVGSSNKLTSTKPTHKQSKSTTTAEVQRDLVGPIETAALMDSLKMEEPPMSLEQSRERRESIKAERRASINFIRARTASRAANEDQPPIIQQLREEMKNKNANETSPFLDNEREMLDSSAENEAGEWKVITAKGARSRTTAQGKKASHISSGQTQKKSTNPQKQRYQNQNQAKSRKNTRSNTAQSHMRKHTPAQDKHQIKGDRLGPNINSYHEHSTEDLTDQRSQKKTERAKVNIDSQDEFPALPSTLSKTRIPALSSTPEATPKQKLLVNVSALQKTTQSQVHQEDTSYDTTKQGIISTANDIQDTSSHKYSPKHSVDAGVLSVNTDIDDPASEIYLPTSSGKHKMAEDCAIRTDYSNRSISPKADSGDRSDDMDVSHPSLKSSNESSPALGIISIETNFGISDNHPSLSNSNYGDNANEEYPAWSDYSSYRHFDDEIDESSDSTLGKPALEDQSQVASEQNICEKSDELSTEPRSCQTFSNIQNQPIHTGPRVDDTATIPTLAQAVPLNEIHGRVVNPIHPTANPAAVPSYGSQPTPVCTQPAANPTIATPGPTEQGQPSGVQTVVNQVIYMPPPVIFNQGQNFPAHNNPGAYHEQNIAATTHPNAHPNPPPNPYSHIPQFCLRCGTQEYSCVYCTPGATGANFPIGPTLMSQPGQHCFVCRNYINGCANCLGRTARYCILPLATTVHNTVTLFQPNNNNYGEHLGNRNDSVPAHLGHEHIHHGSVGPDVSVSASVHHIPPPPHVYTWPTPGQYDFNDFVPYPIDINYRNNGNNRDVDIEIGGGGNGGAGPSVNTGADN